MLDIEWCYSMAEVLRQTCVCCGQGNRQDIRTTSLRLIVGHSCQSMTHCNSASCFINCNEKEKKMYTLTIYTWVVWTNADGNDQAKRVVAHVEREIDQPHAEEIVKAWKANNNNKQRGMEYVLTSRKYL